MQVDSRLLDDLARVAGSAMGAASGMRGEVEAAVRRRLEQALSGMDLVSRDEFDAVREMAAKARTEQETLNKRVAELEAAIERMQG
jgi:BMFP domain-containing protein YqiC